MTKYMTLGENIITQQNVADFKELYGLLADLVENHRKNNYKKLKVYIAASPGHTTYMKYDIRLDNQFSKINNYYVRRMVKDVFRQKNIKIKTTVDEELGYDRLRGVTYHDKGYLVKFKW